MVPYWNYTVHLSPWPSTRKSGNIIFENFDFLRIIPVYCPCLRVRGVRRTLLKYVDRCSLKSLNREVPAVSTILKINFANLYRFFAWTVIYFITTVAFFCISRLISLNWCILPHWYALQRFHSFVNWNSGMAPFLLVYLEMLLELWVARGNWTVLPRFLTY